MNKYELKFSTGESSNYTWEFYAENDGQAIALAEHRLTQYSGEKIKITLHKIGTPIEMPRK